MKLGGRKVRERLDNDTLLAVRMEKRTTGLGMQVVSGSRKRQGNVFSLRAPQKEHSPADTSTAVQRNPGLTSDLQNRRKLDVL